MRERCHPLKVAILPWVQVPLWITLSLGLRKIIGIPSIHEPSGMCDGNNSDCNCPSLSADTLANLATQGALWFGDLTAPDPYKILPITLSVATLLNIEVCYTWYSIYSSLSLGSQSHAQEPAVYIS